jgi:hypothetical protein
MAVDYATLKKGGFMRQKQKNNFSLRIRVVGGRQNSWQWFQKLQRLTEKDMYISPPVREWRFHLSN